MKMFEIYISVIENGIPKAKKILGDKQTALFYAKKGKFLIDRYRK